MTVTSRPRGTGLAVPPWNGRRAAAARRYMEARLPSSCWRCGRALTGAEPWVVGHRLARATHPELTWEPTNWAHECRPCSDASAQAVVQANAAAQALRAAGIDPSILGSQQNLGVFSRDTPGAAPPPLPTPPPKTSGNESTLEIPGWLRWDPEALAEAPWLSLALDVPEDAGVPLAMTPVPIDAVGSYGIQAIEWVERTQQITLRWWQRLAILRQLEHREDGSLVWRTVVESCPRRAGKSVRLATLALWRLEHGLELFGEQQLVLHSGKDVAIVREVQRSAWRWAEEVAGWKVSRGRGSEQIESPDGARWLAKAQDAVYGYSVTMALVDEVWGVSPDAVDEGMEPATLERSSPQLHLTSTAHRRATSLMRSRISDALATDDGSTLLMLWAAPAGADWAAESTWRAASPHWSEDRRKMIATKHAKAMAGEVDPEADDLDPLKGWAAQYLNQWTLRRTESLPGEAVVSEETWAGLLSAEGPEGAPRAVAVEGWPGEGLSVVAAWPGPATVLVRSQDVPDVATAAALVRAWRPRTLLVGASLAQDPAWRGLRVTERTSTVRSAVADLAGLLRDDVLRHDGGEHLGGQVLGLRTSPGPDGLRMRSMGRADAVKAAVWAVGAARRRPSSGGLRILGPDD